MEPERAAARLRLRGFLGRDGIHAIGRAADGSFEVHAASLSAVEPARRLAVEAAAKPYAVRWIERPPGAEH